MASNRRKFLKLTAAGAAGAAALAACGAPAAPTAAPKPTEAPKAAAPTSAPAAAPTAAPKPTEAPKAAAPEPTKPAAAAPTAAPAAAKPTEAPKAATEGQTIPSGLKNVPRNRTLIVIRGGSQGKFTEWNLWNPFIPVGANHQFGSQVMIEPLAFYSAFADKEHMWLAESYKFSDDFKTLTIKTRPGITWSDGKPFGAEDVAFSLNKAAELGPKVKWGNDVKLVMEKAEVVDPNTVKVTFKVPAPRFFNQLSYAFDIGFYIVPKHIFEKEELDKFPHFDLAKGLPVTTGPYRVVHSSPQQKIMDRADDWWGVKAGIAPLPAVERYVYLPDQGEQQLVQSIIKNEADLATGIQPSSFPTVIKGNPKARGWTGQKMPWGYCDWWPHSLYVNCEKEPWSDKNVRWALSYYLDRNKVVDIAWSGDSEATPLPVPAYPAWKPYVDAVKPLLEKYNTLEYNPKKGDELLTKKGWKKNAQGMWLDEKGQPVKLEIISFFDFTSVGPVVVEMLKRAGIDSSYSEPPDRGDRFASGKFDGDLHGHGGGFREPYLTLKLYQSASVAIPGGHSVNFSRWHNDAYDKITDQMYATSPTDTAKLKELWVKAMEIWIPELPDIQLTQGYHRLPWTEEYWTNFPTAQNPYVNTAHFHLTFQLVLHQLKPVK